MPGAESMVSRPFTSSVRSRKFTIPKLLDQDFTGTMKLLADSGYQEVEFFGPYAFSAPVAQERL